MPEQKRRIIVTEEEKLKDEIQKLRSWMKMRMNLFRQFPKSLSEDTEFTEELNDKLNNLEKKFKEIYLCG